MSGERASKTRMRLAGRICWRCGAGLDAAPWQSPGERACERCDPANKPRKVRMAFTLVGDHWHCTFSDEERHIPLPRTYSFAIEDKITDLARRGGGLKCLADVQALEHGLRGGRGNVSLLLTPEQYDKLAR
jgi:hypothetical protein